MKKRPNILWLCADQQRYDTIRALAERAFIKGKNSPAGGFFSFLLNFALDFVWVRNTSLGR